MLSLSTRVFVTRFSLGPAPSADSPALSPTRLPATPPTRYPGGWSFGQDPGGLLKSGSEVHEPWDQSALAGASLKTWVMSASRAAPKRALPSGHRWTVSSLRARIHWDFGAW